MPQLSLTYDKLKKAIAAELSAGMERIKVAYQQEFVRTYWNIGRVCRENFSWEDKPSTKNAKIVKRLSRDLKRPESFFYDSMKFYRMYPKLPDTGLSWSHYSLLIRVEDAQKRLMLERRALREGINAKDFRCDVRVGGTVPGSGTVPTTQISVVRGKLYHYRAVRCDSNNLDPDRILVDIGFGIEHEVKAPASDNVRSGRIVRTVKLRGLPVMAPLNSRIRGCPLAGEESCPECHSFMPSRSGHSGDRVKEGEDYAVKISPVEVERLYTYKAVIERVVDGDTLVARIDLGFRSWITQKLRLRAIDCPEITTALGLKAKLYVQEVLADCPCVVVKTYKEEKFGRFLADILYKQKDADPEKVLEEGIFLNQELLDKKLAGIYQEST